MLREQLAPIVRRCGIRRARVTFQRDAGHHRCRLEARLWNGTRVIVQARAHTRQSALDAASSRLQATLREPATAPAVAVEPS